MSLLRDILAFFAWGCGCIVILVAWGTIGVIAAVLSTVAVVIAAILGGTLLLWIMLTDAWQAYNAGRQ
jgi:uncharacterized membrane protein